MADPDGSLGFKVKPDELDGCGQSAQHIGGLIPGETAKITDPCSQAAGRTTSSIAWIGYDAPQNIVPEAADDTYAKNAEDKLHGFEVGLHATHDGNIANNTILGHSYGTTTIGYTMKDKGLPVDNVVLVGSPGAGVDTARDLHIDPSHVYAAQSQGDPIGLAPAVDPGGLADNAWDNMKSGFGFGGDDHHLIHGRQTTAPEFGAQILPTDPNGGHSDYWNANSPTLPAMGRIIAGK